MAKLSADRLESELKSLGFSAARIQRVSGEDLAAASLIPWRDTPCGRATHGYLQFSTGAYAVIGGVILAGAAPVAGVLLCVGGSALGLRGLKLIRPLVAADDAPLKAEQAAAAERREEHLLVKDIRAYASQKAASGFLDTFAGDDDEALLRHLRQGFLSLKSPGMVDALAARIDARRLADLPSATASAPIRTLVPSAAESERRIQAVQAKQNARHGAPS